MAASIPRELVEFLLLGAPDDRRQLQDSPLLADVWMQYAREPKARLDLLITPYGEQPAARVAAGLAAEVDESARVAYLQGIVAARLTFAEVLREVAPRTAWWAKAAEAVRRYFDDPGQLHASINEMLGAAKAWHAEDWPEVRDRAMQDHQAHERYVTLAALLLWAGEQKEALPEKFLRPGLVGVLTEVLWEALPTMPAMGKPLIWTVALNRRVSAAIARSVPAVKGDAARSLFQADCSRLVWAVVDSGIDGAHPAFGGRVKRAFDFTRIRDLVGVRKARAKEVLRPELAAGLDGKSADRMLKKLAEGAADGKPVDWELVAPFVEIRPDVAPESNHGTHVAGILGAAEVDGEAEGMCPDIQLYDFRVLSRTVEDTEFAVIAALQFIRYLNGRNSFPVVHGANLSLSIPHEVQNYGCGQTPVCVECERLVESGVVVVAAAGNRGYQRYQTRDGLFEGYAASSVTDPGNGDAVITVGSTHRHSPHTYGVSFFSSRGPTGDGRLKPDLVAPGERIRGPLPGGEWGDLDGTSMAAPHVSGAAALLMARYPELVGQPRRIKEILCRTATDLGRERSFQGHGMLDVLRAMQSL